MFKGTLQQFKIIKDCSPYYITFTYTGLDDYIKLLQNTANKSEFVVSNNKSVTAIQEVYPDYQTEEFYVKDDEDLTLIIDNNPCSKLLHLDKSAAFLTTYPGVKSPIHVDINAKANQSVNFRINYPVFIKDNQCITNWYDSQDIVIHEKINYILDESIKKHKCVESLHFSQEHAILFNTAIYHEWDNTLSSNTRTIVGMRANNEHCDMTFADAKKILFGI
jgi:hypothetical protein